MHPVPIFIHGMYKYRTMEDLVLESLNNMRVVSVTGARQVGKTTLVKRLCSRMGMDYVNFEDSVIRAAAQADPDQWLEANPSPLAIDEIQHVPDLFRAIKRRVDANPKPGQYLITGSALWLSMKKIGESLAGRVAILELWPFRFAEWHEKPSLDLLALCLPRLDTKLIQSLISQNTALPSNWLADAILCSGFPVPAGFTSERQRRLWFESYVSTYLQRDVLDFVRIEHPSAYARLIRLLASRTGQILNVSSLARDLGIPQPTARRYAEWLQITYQRFEVPPYSANLGKRLVKMPKNYWVDTGMATALLGLKSWKELETLQLIGPMVETWVAGEIKKWGAATGHVPLYFWRSHDGGEVDFLLEVEGQVVGIEVKTGQKLGRRDLAGLYECRQALGKRFRRGIVLYGGSTFLPLNESMIALPLSLLAGNNHPTAKYLKTKLA